MNPLFLLLGLFGITAFGSSSSSGSTTTTTTGLLNTPTGPVDTDENEIVTDNPDPVITEAPAEVPAPVAETPDTPEEVEPPVVVVETPDVPVEETPEEPVAETPDVPVEETPEEPVEETPEEPEEVPTGNSGNVDAPQQNGDGTNGGQTDPVTASNSVQVMAGRVATLEAQGSDIASVSIVSGVEHGNITVNPDNTLALVMTTSDFTGNQSFTYEVTHSDGSTDTYQTNLNVTPGAQAGGWGTGESHYMLETDDDDRVIVETGENHQKLYVSNSDNALSRADIARMENMSEGQITNEWLVNSQYGKTEGTALSGDIGNDVWNTMTPRGTIASNWLLLERGYEYDDIGTLSRYSGGESELHPMYLGAWGEGDRPEITTQLLQQDVGNLVIQDIHFTGGFLLLGNNNVIMDNIQGSEVGSGIMNSSGITVRNSEFIDNYPENPNGDDWHPHIDRSVGVYMNTTEGTLWEGNFFDHNGWDEDYESGNGAPPSMFSQNIYFDAEMSDVTLRDTISMRAASFGAQVRSGGFVEDNLFADNNAGFTTLGGDYEGAGAVGQYSLLQGNVVTYAAYKEADMIGALTWGLYDEAVMTSLVDNIVAHLADPNADESYKIWNHGGFEVGDTAYYDDTVVWNWESFRAAENDGRVTEQNVEGLDAAALDQTTIQLFTEQLTGIENATTEDLANYLRAQADGALDDDVDADLINRFFQEGFGVATDIRDSAETITFVPNDIGEGVRWDNRLNWETNDLPGLFPSDSVDLNGNYVTHGANTTIDTLDLSGGHLSLYGGRLDATGGLEDDGLVALEGSGQLWAGGSDGSALDIEVSDSARFANTGDMSGANLTVNDGQAILATDGGEYDVSASRFLKVFEAAKVGFDGDNGDTAILDIHDDGTVEFEASNGDLGEIGEFRSGALGDNQDVMSGIDLGNGNLSVNLSGLSAADGASFQLMSADEIVGIFEEAMVDGLNGQDARVVIDYTNDTVTLELTSGNGAVSIDTVGDQADVSNDAQAIWDALTVDQGVVSETQSAAMDDDDEDDLIAA